MQEGGPNNPASMPITYKGAIKKKTRRRRILPKTFRKQLEEPAISLFECLSIDQIKKMKSSVGQCTEAAVAARGPEKENQKRLVRFETLGCYKKSPALKPGSANSTFDKLLKQTPLQSLEPQQGTNSSKSIVSSSGSSVKLGAAHHYFTRLQASGGASSSMDGNAEWDQLYRSLKTTSPDCIPDTPVCAIVKSRRKPLSVRQNVCSSAALPAAVDHTLPISVIFLQTQVTSTPIVSPAFEADLFSLSPLGTQHKNRFLSSATRDCDGKVMSAEDVVTPEMETFHESGQTKECLFGQRIGNTPKISNDTLMKAMVNTRRRKITQRRDSSKSQETVVATPVLSEDSSTGSGQEHSCKSVESWPSGSCLLEEHSAFSVQSIRLGEIAAESKHPTSCTSTTSDSISNQSEKFAPQDVQKNSPTIVCIDVSARRNQSDVYIDSEWECPHVVLGCQSRSISSNVENEVNTSTTDQLVPTRHDATVELSSLLEEHLSLSPARGASVAAGVAGPLQTVDGSLHAGEPTRGASLSSRLSAPGNESGVGSCVSSNEVSRVSSGSCRTPVGVCPPGEEQHHSHRILSGMLESDPRGPSQQWTPRQKRIRLSHFVVVDDVQPSLAKCQDSSFRSVYDSCASEPSERSAMLSSARLGVASLSPARGQESLDQQVVTTARDLVLHKCGQQAPVAFSRAFSRACLNKCKKIGEGVYGEVFLCENGYGGARSVLKIIPIEGDLEVNGAVQKKYKEILSEIVIAMELSSLRDNAVNATSAFSKVLRCLCVRGKYPKRLVDLWDQYAQEKTSENDRPTMFDSSQLFIILELSHAGTDLEAYVFSSAHQGLAVFQQVMCGLAVAELELQFEHRDLHWGNVLVVPTGENTVCFTIHGREVMIQTKGVKATIIDFTLSRMTFEGCHIFNNLSLDPELFVPLDQCQDYQFQIYTFMRIAVEDDWKKFVPKTNVYWLHYLSDKLIKMARYQRTRTKVHSAAKNVLQHLYDSCLSFDSATSFLTTCLEMA